MSRTIKHRTEIEPEDWEVMMVQKAKKRETLEYQVRKAIKEYCEKLRKKDV